MNVLNFDGKLTRPDLVDLWFANPTWQQDARLKDYGESPEEQAYLHEIEAIAERTGANNITLCIYIMELEKRLARLERQINSVDNKPISTPPPDTKTGDTSRRIFLGSEAIKFGDK